LLFGPVEKSFYFGVVLLSVNLINDAFVFPKDEGRHTDALYEWWYFNSHLQTETGKQYGLFVAFIVPSTMFVVLADKSSKQVIKQVVRGEDIVKCSLNSLNLECSNNLWQQDLSKNSHYHLSISKENLKINLEM
jgi:hypothetical protein